MKKRKYLVPKDSPTPLTTSTVTAPPTPRPPRDAGRFQVTKHFATLARNARSLGFDRAEPIVGRPDSSVKRMSTSALIRKIREIEAPRVPRLGPTPALATADVKRVAEEAVERKIGEARSADLHAAKLAKAEQARNEGIERKSQAAALAAELRDLRKSRTIGKRIIRGEGRRITHVVESLPGGAVNVKEVIRDSSNRVTEVKETQYEKPAQS